MKKLAILWLACLLLVLPGTAAGQGGSGDKSRTSKAFTVSGQVSQDGKKLIGKNGEPWLVENPDALAGHEGQQVKVKYNSLGQSRRARGFAKEGGHGNEVRSQPGGLGVSTLERHDQAPFWVSHHPKSTSASPRLRAGHLGAGSTAFAGQPESD